MADATQYYYNLDAQRTALEQAQTFIQAEIPSGDDTELSQTNFSQIAYDIGASLLETERQLSIHKLFRMDKTDFESMLAGDVAGKYSSKVTHTIRSIDTMRIISNLYGVDAEDILAANNTTAAQLNDLTELIIPIKQSPARTIYPDILTMGSHEGVKVLGKDVAIGFDVDAGDLVVLDEIATFEQGVKILISTTAGDVPFDESFGAAPTIGDEIPPDARSSFISVNLVKGLNQDKRIDDIDNLDVQSQGQDSFMATMDVRPVNSADYIKVTNS